MHEQCKGRRLGELDGIGRRMRRAASHIDAGPAAWVPVHTYLLAQAGVPSIEVVYLEELARNEVSEFAFIAASLKFRGASAAPFRPIALPLRRVSSASLPKP